MILTRESEAVLSLLFSSQYCICNKIRCKEWVDHAVQNILFTKFKLILLSPSPLDVEHAVQLYLSDQFATVTRPLKSLQAFARVSLAASDSETVTLSLSPKELSLYDEDLNFVQEPRQIEVLIGDQIANFRIVPRVN